MATQQFFLCGDGVNTAVELDISAVQTIDELRRSIAAYYGCPGWATTSKVHNIPKMEGYN
jgi:hypothetical protein